MTDLAAKARELLAGELEVEGKADVARVVRDSDSLEKFADLRAVIRAIEKALATPAPAKTYEDWQPIETAPKDGKTEVDLWVHYTVEATKFRSQRRVVNCKWWPKGWFDQGGMPLEWSEEDEEDGHIDSFATHWRPLPAPPGLPSPPALEAAGEGMGKPLSVGTRVVCLDGGDEGTIIDVVYAVEMGESGSQDVLETNAANLRALLLPEQEDRG